MCQIQAFQDLISSCLSDAFNIIKQGKRKASVHLNDAFFRVPKHKSH